MLALWMLIPLGVAAVTLILLSRRRRRRSPSPAELGELLARSRVAVRRRGGGTS